MAPFAARLDAARRLAAGHPRIRISDFEDRLGTFYTVDTVRQLRRRFPRRRFVWIMGSDNLAQLPRWARWPEIFAEVPIAVFARPSNSSNVLAGTAAKRFARRRVPVVGARSLAEMMPPAWAFFHTRLDPRSATAIRAASNRTPSPHPMEQGTELTAIVPLKPQIPAGKPDLLHLVLETLEDGKAEEIVTIELEGKTTFADQMVIASGRSARQVKALTEHLEQALSRRTHIAIEGKGQADWVLIDAGDVIVHLFRPEIRAYYNLEKMWGEAFPDAELIRG
jgi:ribosome silencing factor RsfS/YbeB/iojap/nicotinate (nicotinamide) nucleotide adenylyltransferase